LPLYVPVVDVPDIVTVTAVLTPFRPKCDYERLPCAWCRRCFNMHATEISRHVDSMRYRAIGRVLIATHHRKISCLPGSDTGCGKRRSQQWDTVYAFLDPPVTGVNPQRVVGTGSVAVHCEIPKLYRG
jgi:hypothetical protein